jgi:membrane associated rhomboid family serine protease
MGYYRQGPGGGGVTIGVPPLTPMVKRIVIVCASVWALQFILGMFGQYWPALVFGVVPAWFIRGFLWQPLTYLFLHDNAMIMHLVINMLILWMIGGDLERNWGSRGFLRYYLVCGVGAGLLVVVLAPFGSADAMTRPTIGASGAIYGLILAYGVLFSERTMLFMMIFPMKARTLAIILFFIAFVSAFGSGSRISHVAHLGGMVIGYLYLKRAWRVGEFYRELKWKLARRRFRVVQRDDQDRWMH